MINNDHRLFPTESNSEQRSSIQFQINQILFKDDSTISKSSKGKCKKVSCHSKIKYPNAITAVIKLHIPKQ